MKRTINRLVVTPADKREPHLFPAVFSWFQNGTYIATYQHPLEVYWAMAQ